MRESAIESKSCKWAKLNGWLPFKFVSPNQRAVPDRLFIKDGVVVFVEFKALGKKPTKLQAALHEKMKNYGAKVYVVDSYEGFIDVMS